MSASLEILAFRQRRHGSYQDLVPRSRIEHVQDKVLALSIRASTVISYVVPHRRRRVDPMGILVRSTGKGADRSNACLQDWDE